jgi:hypothetical protein
VTARHKDDARVVDLAHAKQRALPLGPCQRRRVNVITADWALGKGSHSRTEEEPMEIQNR